MFAVDKNKQKIFLKKVMLILSALLLLLTVLVIIFSLNIRRISIEAGESISAEDIVGKEGAVFDDDYDADFVNHPGVYNFGILANDKRYKVRLKVKDTKAPEVTVKNVYFAVGSTLPDPLEFIDTVYEPDELFGEYVSGNTDLVYSLGQTYDACVRYYDASGNTTETFDVKMTLINDSEPPVIQGASDIVAYVGEAVSYKNNITLSDNCTGRLTLRVDDSAVNTSVAGTYKVTYYATDAVGNTSSVEVNVHVYKNEITLEMLNAKLSDIVPKIIDEGMTKEEQCRAVYDYVQTNIQYVNYSDKTDWIRAAYDSLFVSGAGDCYSYFAAAKAFLEYLGIENMDIQRLAGYTTDTHYWSLVNIGTEEDPRWYHFDCTRLRAEYNHSGCLLTDSQVDAYSSVRANFYKYNRSEYPATDTRIITETPSLDDYLD